MNRNILIALVILNTAILLWGARNHYLLSDPAMTEVTFQIKETPPLSRQSVEIMKDYTDHQKVEHVNKIIHLYNKLVAHLESTKNITLESIDTLYDYVYFYFAVSLINIVLLFALLRAPRHNKSINRT